MTSALHPADPPCGPGESGVSDSGPSRLDFQRFRLLVENSRDLIVEVSHDGRILYVSPNIQTVLGYRPEELTGASMFARVHPEDLGHAQTQFITRASRATARHRHKDGSWRWLETSGQEFIAPGGAEHRVLIARDVTEQKLAEAERERLESELIRAEKLTALGTIAGGIAHDFNNLLTAIIAYAHLARVDSRQPEVLDALAQILKATDRAKHLAKQILTFCRQQKHDRDFVRPATIVQEVLKLMGPTIPPSITVVADIRDDAGWVHANSTQIHQVISNLCSNAVHAMRQRPGRLEVRLARVVVGDRPSQPPAFGLRPGAYACLSVTDDGHGIDAATQRRVFEPFFTTKQCGDGTGLGLAVVQRIVRDHDGVINFRSQPGEGTTFRVYLPACAEPPPSNAADAPLHGKRQRILVVDDEPIVCETAAALLENADYTVTTQTAPREALALFRARPDDFDLVITDVAMPGLTGVDLAVEIMRLKPGTPVVLTSGALGGWTAERARRLGIRGVLAKPLTTSALLAAVRGALPCDVPASRPAVPTGPALARASEENAGAVPVNPNLCGPTPLRL